MKKIQLLTKLWQKTLFLANLKDTVDGFVLGNVITTSYVSLFYCEILFGLAGTIWSHI